MIRVGQGFDVHQLIPQRPLIINGVTLPYEKGLSGHSGTDVLIHAIIDAILDAAGLGGIGQLLPKTDPQFKNTNSVNLLRETGEKAGRLGFTTGDIDCTILAEEPETNPYLAEMKESLAVSCHSAVIRVNIKARLLHASSSPRD